MHLRKVKDLKSRYCSPSYEGQQDLDQAEKLRIVETEIQRIRKELGGIQLELGIQPKISNLTHQS